MQILFWLFILVVAGGVIYWLMDWQSHFPDGD